MAKARVVITGLGVLSPNAHGAEHFHSALRSGESGVRFIEELARLGFSCQVGGLPRDADALEQRYFSAEQRYAMNSNIAYAGIAAIDAWEDAGLRRPTGEDDNVDWDAGAVIGTGIAGMETIAGTLVPGVSAGRVQRLGSTMVEQIMASGNSARVAGLLGLGNQVSTNSAACATGTEAIAQAFLRVRDGYAKRMLAGGSEGSSPFVWAGFDAMRVLNRRHNQRPSEASRPLSATSGGFVPGAGAGVLLLEELESAKRRGARIYAEIAGACTNCGGQRMGGSMTAPNREGVRRCIREAVRMAGIAPRDIGAINGHLTGTMADPIEVENWARALELEPDAMPLLHSTKSLIGHTLAAAGGIETVACALELYHGFVHPSVNCVDVHPEIAAYADRIAHESRSVPDLRYVAKASFGFGDVNACLILSRWNG
ncbi:MAG: beta-ketoacyl-[acyl-carrier-protein] synthase family protein [Myxococcota bacterium]